MAELQKIDDMLYLVDDNQLSLAADFSAIAEKGRLRANAVSQDPLVKAVRIKGTQAEAVRVVDATAGFAEDSLVLAAAGYSVTAIEQCLELFELICFAKKHAEDGTDTRLQEAARRLTPIHSDSKAYMRELIEVGSHVDVVYLDPMFPEVRGKSLPKKKMQLISELAGACTDEVELLTVARELAAKKVVVKRPIKGRHLADLSPNYSQSYKTIRYDIYL